MRGLRLAVLAAAFAAGCGPLPTHVAQGETYTTGNAAFDEFFASVKSVRADGLSAPSDEQASHAALLKALGLDAKTATAQSLEEAKARAAKLRDKGVLLHLEIAPEPKLLTVKGKGDVGADGAAVLKAVEDAARAALELNKRLAAVTARAADLEKKRAELRAKAEQTFLQESPVKRDEIIAELDGAKGVLAGAGDAASRSAGAASRFVVDLVQAVETGGVAGDAGKPARGGKKAATWAAGKAPAAAPAAPVAAPAAPPPKKAKGGDDFEP